MTAAVHDDCPFCQIAAGTLHAEVLHRDEATIAFLDRTAVMEGHTLVVPRAHAANLWEIGEADAAAVMRTVHRTARLLRDVLAPDGLTLFQANEEAGWQDVFHLHVHLVPRRTGDPLRRPWSARPADPAELARTRQLLLGRRAPATAAHGTTAPPAPAPAPARAAGRTESG
ncbi:HIT family protein [Streptomyces sp. NPDC088387]|uniref:HIT family protein n=1 Tax=Streptomyces sp. NPDC088387 TaxID=3365859 RepID=UPI003825D3CF